MFSRTRNREFEALALPLFEHLYNFGYWLAGSRDEAEELVQETFVKALRGFDGFRPGTNFKAWMFRILRNTFLTSRSGLKNAPVVDVDDPGVEALAIDVRDNPEAHLLQMRDRDAIERALEELPIQYREVILLCDVEEMRYQEIAETLMIPIGTVMSRLGRGRKMMRALLGELRQDVARKQVKHDL